MKTNKTKSENKTAKRDTKKQIEKSLTEKFFDVVKTLGHNAEDIAEDIAKAGKSVAKKLSKKFSDTKSVVEKNADKAKKLKKSKVDQVKTGKKGSSKLKKVDKSVSKIAKTAVAKTKPLATSVKMKNVATLEKPELNDSTVVKEASPKPKTMKNKSEDEKVSEKKTVVKAVTNNPVKKVAAKAVPTKDESKTTKK